MQRLNLDRTFPAIILLSFAIQACVMGGPVGAPVGPGLAPPMNPSFDAYDVCIRGIQPLPFWDVNELKSGERDCFKQTIQVNHLALPAGTTAEQAFAKFRDCVKQNAPISVGVGPFLFNGNNRDTARQNCFTSALK
jgi:hypothetical protein